MISSGDVTLMLDEPGFKWDRGENGPGCCGRDWLVKRSPFFRWQGGFGSVGGRLLLPLPPR